MELIDGGDLQHMLQDDPMGELQLFIENKCGKMYKIYYSFKLKVILFG